MKTAKELFTKYKILIAVVLLAVLAVLDLANFGLPPTHDGEYHVLRFEQFHKALREGYLYPRWAADFNNGFGVPLFNYVYPLPNYFAAFFHFLGVSFINAFKLNMAAASIVGAIFFYLWSRKYWGELGGLVSSVFYTYSPYHLLDIYVRGSVGEVWGLGLAPGLLWAYLKFHESKSIVYLCISAIFLGLLVLAHNILALVFFAFFLVYAVYLIYTDISVKDKLKEVRNLILVIGLGLGASSVFWLPALMETKYVRGLQVFDPTQHFPEIHKLIYSSWGYGFSGPGVADQMSLQIGLVNLLVIALSIIALIFSKKRKMTIFFLVCLFITVFFITPFSSLFWKHLPIISYLQFPWRLLSLVILLVSFIAGFLASDILSHKKRLIASISLIILCLVLNYRYASAPFYHERFDSHYFTRANFTDGTNSPGNAFNTLEFNDELLKANGRVSSRQAELIINSNKTSEIRGAASSDKGGIILVNIAYFPGWKALVNGELVPLQVTKDGLFEFTVPSGDSSFEIELGNTKVRQLSIVLSIISIAILFGLFVRDKYIKIKL